MLVVVVVVKVVAVVVVQYMTNFNCLCIVVIYTDNICIQIQPAHNTAHNTLLLPVKQEVGYK